jgi:hypothetical protein
VHRDCKPANILVADHGRVAVLDWGIAAPVGALSDPACGSPAWLAPEAARAEPLSVAPALDSWGLGALLHHLLTGRPPHAGASAADAVAAAARWAGPPPLPGPPALAALAAAGLDPDPARRPTAAAVADRLRAWLERSGDADAAAAALAEAEAALAGDGDAHHRHQTALAAVERAVALAPDHPGAAALADRIRIAWARLLVAGGDLTLAADLLADAGANAPGRAEATTALAAARAARTAARVHDRRRRRWLTGTMATVALIVVGLPVHHLLDDHAAARERRQQAAALLAAVPAGDDLAALLARAEAADRARGLDPHGPAPRTAQAAAHAALATWAEREGLTAMARFHRERAGR